MRLAMIIFLLSALLFSPCAASAQEITWPSQNPDFSVDDIRRMAKENPASITDQLAFAFGVQSARNGKNAAAVRDALPKNVRASFDSGYTFGKNVAKNSGGMDPDAVQKAFDLMQKKSTGGRQ